MILTDCFVQVQMSKVFSKRKQHDESKTTTHMVFLTRDTNTLRHIRPAQRAQW